MQRESKHVIYRTKSIQQGSTPALVIDFIEVVQDLPKLLRPLEGFLLLAYSFLLCLLLFTHSFLPCLLLLP